MHRRDAVKTLLALWCRRRRWREAVGVDSHRDRLRGLFDQHVNNPYGLAIGPDRAL